MAEKHRLTEYFLTVGLEKKLTIGLVADLHERDPEWVLRLLRQEKPDLILVAGDTFERHGECRDTQQLEEGRAGRLVRHALMKADDFIEVLLGEGVHDTEAAYRFLREAGSIAPVFLSSGNHEWYFTPEDLAVMKESGTTLLENGDCEIRRDGETIRIGGLSGIPDLHWVREFAQKDGYKILLCHHPEYYTRFLKELSLDLIVSGHAHGGQIRIGNRGIYSPGQGLFPRYTKGVYDGRLVVTSGASNTASVPRWGNPCEVVLIHCQ